MRKRNSSPIWTKEAILAFAKENGLSTVYHLKTDSADALAYKTIYRGEEEIRVAIGSRVAPDKTHFASYYETFPQAMRTTPKDPSLWLIHRNKVIGRFAFDKLSEAARAILCDLTASSKCWKRISIEPSFAQ